MNYRRYIPREHDLNVLARTIREGGNPYIVGSAFGMSPRTIRRRTSQIMANNFNPPEISLRGGIRNQIITMEMEDWMIKYVEENSSATLEEIKLALLNRFNLPDHRISLSTIHNHLDGQLITYKEQRYVSPHANSEEVMGERVNYLNQLTHLPENIKQIYIDETNFNILTRRNKGRSKKGTRAIQSTIINGCRKINLIGSVCPNYGWIYHELETNNINSIRFENYIQNLIEYLHLNYSNDQFVFILYNVSIHRKNELVNICNAANIQLLFLPPYSPYLNPIERCFSQIKSYVKEWLQNNNQRLIDTINLPFGQKGAKRFEMLMEAINYAIPQVTSANVQNYLNYSQRFYPQIFQRIPILSE